MKRRIFISMVSMMAMTVFVLPVHGAEGSEHTTDLKAEVTSSYILTIPKETTIAYQTLSNKLNGVLSVKGNVKANEKVVVTAATKPLHCTAQDKDLPYKLMNGSAEFTQAEWNEEELRKELEAEGTGKNLQLTADITKDAWDAAEAGSYEGSVMFKAELAAAP